MIKETNRLTEEIREQRKTKATLGIFETTATFTFSLLTCRNSPTSPILLILLALDSHGNPKTKQIHRILELGKVFAILRHGLTTNLIKFKI